MRKMLAVFIVLLLLLIALYWFGFATDAKGLEDRSTLKVSKPVVLLIVDSLMDEPLRAAISEGRAPALQFLMEKGLYYPEMVSSYPTMSVTIDSTLLTGTYSDEHRLPGLVWYDEAEQRVINYGSARGEIMRLGTKKVLFDGVYQMNHDHLSEKVETVHEALYKDGLSSASINGMIFRGDVEQHLTVPRAISGLNFLPKNLEIKGPELFVLGSLSRYNPKNQMKGTAWQAFGMNDSFAIQEMKHLILKDKMPAFSLVYMSDLDKSVHKKGRMDLKGVEQVDKEIGKLLDAYGSWEEAKEQAVWIVLGDSGQARVKDKDEDSLIRLASLTDHYQVDVGTKRPAADDQLVFALNERMAYVYLMDDSLAYKDVFSMVSTDDRIGWIAWKEDDVNHVVSGTKRMQFQPGGDLVDEYGKSWSLDGDATVLDLFIEDDRTIRCGDYPDALSRLNGALHSHEGRYLILDAKPGFEFATEHSPTHPGGASHGSLHRDDSITPMIVTGTDVRPATNRLVDLKSWILELVR